MKYMLLHRQGVHKKRHWQTPTNTRRGGQCATGSWSSKKKEERRKKEKKTADRAVTNCNVHSHQQKHLTTRARQVIAGGSNQTIVLEAGKCGEMAERPLEGLRTRDVTGFAARHFTVTDKTDRTEARRTGTALALTDLRRCSRSF